MVGLDADELIALGGYGNDGASPSLDLLDLADHLVVNVVLGHNGDYRHRLVDQGNRAVLHLTGRIVLGVDI